MAKETVQPQVEQEKAKKVSRPVVHGRNKMGEKFLLRGEGKTLKIYENTVTKKINSKEEAYQALSDEQLRAKTDEFRDRLAKGETTADILPDAFATAREAAHRVLGKRPYDVQLMGGVALHDGHIAEMKTGEGKTLTAAMPAYLQALSGEGVHVVTVNDYLAQRDAELLKPLYEFLGLSVGVILPNRPAAEHRAAYNCDITYGTNNEFGFDYLRDNMAWSKDERVQRGHHFAIVDEVDSILIDEARNALIISGPTESEHMKWYPEFARLTERMMKGEDGEGDYEVDLKKKTVAITERGVAFIEDQLGITEGLYEKHNTPLIGVLNNALRAKEIYKKDKDYIVHDGEVLIVDEHTGRILYERRYNEGQHQAIEAKEHVEVKPENQTLATISLQNYFRLYDTLSGMTGTAKTEENELSKTYNGIEVVQIPTHRPMIREDKSDVIYKSEKAKFDAVVEDIIESHLIGQPVLVGTISVENSEHLSQLLKARGIPHSVLNAKYHAKEAHIIAQAGRRGAVTVATNMAGRGVDILLGGNPEYLAEESLTKKGLSKEENPEEYKAALERFTQQVDIEAEMVVESGGLYVLGTERHDARRIDNQLRGRSGRQGDPGKSRFYLSLEDDLMKRFGSNRVMAVMDWLNIPDNVPIESKMVTRQIASAQTQIEAQNAETRKDMLKYDNVLQKQRETIFAERDQILESEDLRDNVHHIIEDVVQTMVSGATTGRFEEDWNLGELWENLKKIHPPSFSSDQLKEELEKGDDLTPEFLATRVKEDMLAAYDKRVEQVGQEVMHEYERQVLLAVVDKNWREHMYELDYLKDGVGLRAYAQKDPLVEYSREASDYFEQMKDAIKEQTAIAVFNQKRDDNPNTPK